MKDFLWLPLLCSGVLGLTPAFGCGTHGTNAGNTLSEWLDETADSHVGRLTITDNLLVPPEQRTICVCGIGLGSAESPLPAGVEITRVAIVITDSSTGARRVFEPFAFSASANMTTGLQRAADRVSSTGDGPLFRGSTWFGFAAPVAPFELPGLQRGQDIAFEYEIRVPKDTLPFSLDVQFAAGEGLADGSPDFGGAHPVRFFAAGNRSVSLRAPAQTDRVPIRARPSRATPTRQPTRIERQ